MVNNSVKKESVVKFSKLLEYKRLKRDCICGMVLLYFSLGFVFCLGISYNTVFPKGNLAYKEHYRNREFVIVASAESTSRGSTLRPYPSDGSKMVDTIKDMSQKEIYKLNNTIPHTSEERSMMEYIVECDRS